MECLYLLTDPTTHSSNHTFPVVCVPHNDLSTLCIVCGDSHFGNVVRTPDVQCLVNLKLNRKTMTIPAKTTINMVSHLMSVPGDDILNSSSQNVAVMRQTRCKWRTIVKRVSIFKVNLNILYDAMMFNFPLTSACPSIGPGIV